MGDTKSTALAIRDDMGLSELGTVLARSGFFQDIKDASQAVVKVLAGRELGVGPIMSMAHVHVIKGKATVGAAIMAAAVKSSGRYNYRITEHTNEACTVVFHERDGDKWEAVYTSRFTIADARAAGLLGNDTWSKYPRNMLFARAFSNGARFACPEVIMGMYTPEELGAAVDGDGEVVTIVSDTRPVDTVTGEIVEEAPDPIGAPWTRNQADVDKFWDICLNKKALERAEVLLALGVAELGQYRGTGREAMALIDAYIAKAQDAEGVEE